MFWDPEVDSPASIAIIGAGPVGIEASLYARFLGYDVELFDVGRPGREALRWNQRKLGVAVADCTTSLGHRALQAQDEAYQQPESHAEFTGAEYETLYLTPVAKTDLVHDCVQFNRRVVEVHRRRSNLDEVDELLVDDARSKRSTSPARSLKDFVQAVQSAPTLCEPFEELLQQRCDDEFRLIIESRDRGLYTTYADIVIDCRGHEKGVAGWGPTGSSAIGEDATRHLIWPWLPGDRQFEAHRVEGKRFLLFGNSNRARQFATEWRSYLDQNTNAELSLVWIIPSISAKQDDSACALATQLTQGLHRPERFSFLQTLGIERIAFEETKGWRLQLLQSDSTLVDFEGDLFASFPQPRPTPSLANELLSQRLLDLGLLRDQTALSSYLGDWPGWSVATSEPHYYVLGSADEPHHPRGLKSAFAQIRDLFALLGTRRDLNLYS